MNYSALDIPTVKDCEECSLHVGGERYEWVNGIMCDGGAVNTTSHTRMALLIDIERPHSLLPYCFLNKFILATSK